MRIKILHFNDVHSRFEELARVASCVRELRDKSTLVFDAGDNADFARLETEGTCGVISSAILNRIDVDARVFGNNEGFAGKRNGRIITEHSHCPVLTCNMCDMEGRRLKWLDDAAVFDVCGVKVLVIGVTGPYNIFYSLFKILVKDPEEEVRRVLASYNGIPHDLVVLLSHLGLERDKEIVSHVPEIDIAIGGHSHTPLAKPLVEHGRIICQAGSHGESLGELTLDFNTTTKRIRRVEGKLIPAKEYSPSSDIIDLIRFYSEEAERNLSRPLYSVDVTLDHSLTKENSLGNLLADSLKDIMRADLGLVNSGVLHGEISKGTVTKKLLHTVCPSPLNPTYMEVNGSHIHSALEKSLSRDVQLSDGSGAGSRSKYLGNLLVSHNVQISVRLEGGSHRIRSIKVDGEPIHSSKWYSVGTSDFLQRGSGYADLGNNRNERYRVEYLRDILQKYVKRRAFLKQALKMRFKVEEI